MVSAQMPPTLGWEAVDFIERFCLNGPGDVQGEPAVLTDEAIGFLLDAYELEPVSGKRRWKRAMLVRPKGWNKSGLGAWIALFEALGPCRFDRWDGDGKPVGRRVRTPIVRCIATEESQAGNCFDTIHFNVTEGLLARTAGIDAGLTRINLPGGGNIRPVSAGAASKDGGRETFVLFDELHLFLLPELHRLHQTYLRNLRKRVGSDPWSLEVTTAYRPGEGSVAETAMQYAAKIVAGEALDAGFLYDHRQPDPELDLDDPDQRIIALRQAYGDCSWVDFDQITRDWDDPTTDRFDWARYYTSRVVVSADSFIDPADWVRIVDATRSLHDGDSVAVGLDTSLVDDGTAVVACRLSDGHIERLGYWQKPDGRAGVGWQVPYAEVDACVRGAFDRFRVTRLYCDPQYAHSLLDAWGRDFGPKKVFSWPTNRAVPMAAALQRFFVAVRTGERISTDGDTLLATHVGNARTWTSQGRTLIRKDGHHSPRKIDLVVAAVLAYEAAADSVAAGEDAEPAPRSRKAWSR
jgi:phage terminase large subunit-like protein